MKPDWETADGSVRLYLGDCLNVLPCLTADAIVTDPPYGIDYISSHQHSIDYGRIAGDDKPFDPSHLLDRGVPAVLWGANNYADKLPIGGWMVWDKRLSEAADKILGSPFELAWCSRRKSFRIVRALHGGAKNADAPNGDVANQPRFHPTQKPVIVMRKSIEACGEVQTICDPYMGSGSTGLAAIREGRRFIGIEKEPRYFDITVKRIQAELTRAPLFDAAPAIVQRELI